jgi:hypothetical protein
MSGILTVIGIVLLAILLPSRCDAPAPSRPASGIVSQGPTVERLQRLAHLVTMRVYVADVLTAEGEGYRGAWLIKGDALIGVDLSRARITTKDLKTRQATVQLLPPAVLLSRVDHDRTKTWEVQRTTWVPWRGDQDRLRDEVMLHAQRLIAHASASEENLQRACVFTETVIQSLYEEFGWKVTVAWEVPPRASSALRK